ncbi:MAG: glycoside hydrolase family 38 C-terminal domain-containing protein, partial [Clostridia bacterium]
GKFNNITLGENVPYAWDDWDIDADYNIKSESVLQLISTEIISNGALQLRIRNAYKLSDKSTLWQDVVIHALTAQIDFENKLDWRDLHKILRADFCADIATDSIKCETQFGYIERSTKSNTSEEQAQFEFCNHKWSDMSESNYGVTFVNDCKYGVSCKDGLFGLTLATSGNHPDKNANAGVHYFKYGIILHNEAFKANNAVKFGYLFNYQPLLARGKLDFNFVKVDKPNIVVETVKQSEDGKNIVIRLYESERSPTVATIIFDQEYKVYGTDFIEDDKTEIFDGKEISLHFNAFEIKTLILEKK